MGAWVIGFGGENGVVTTGVFVEFFEHGGADGGSSPRATSTAMNDNESGVLVPEAVVHRTFQFVECLRDCFIVMGEINDHRLLRPMPKEVKIAFRTNLGHVFP